MKTRFHLYVAAMVTLVGLISLAPVASARQQGQHVVMVTQAQSPPPAPSPSPSGQAEPSGPSTTKQPDYNTATSRDDRSFSTSRFSWGSFIGGLIVGAIVGYFIPRRPTAIVNVRRDRAA